MQSTKHTKSVSVPAADDDVLSDTDMMLMNVFGRVMCVFVEWGENVCRNEGWNACFIYFVLTPLPEEEEEAGGQRGRRVIL